MSGVRVPQRPPSFAKATDGRPSGMPCVDFFCASKNKRSATERAKDALQSLGDGGLNGSASHPHICFLQASLAMRRFFLLAKISGVQRSVRRMPRRRGASAPEAGQCGTDLQQTHSAAVLSIENDIASQKRVFE